MFGLRISPAWPLSQTASFGRHAAIVTARFRETAAVAHRTPSPVLGSAFIDEEPSAAALVLALPNLLRARSHQQSRGGPGDRFEQGLRRDLSRRGTPFKGAPR